MDVNANLALKFKITEVPMKVKGVDSVFLDKNSSKLEKDGSAGFQFCYSKKEKFQRMSTYFSKSVRTGIIYIETMIELISNRPSSL